MMRSNIATKAASLAIVWALVAVGPMAVLADSRLHTRDEVTGHVPSTHEELLSRRGQHRDVFADRLVEMKQRMEEHTRGDSLLTEAEYYKLEKKIKAYEHKVDHLETYNDSRHLDRVLAREELMNEMHRARLSRSGDEL